MTGEEVAARPDLDVRWGAVRQDAVEGGVEGGDLVTRHGGGIRTQEAGGEGGLCNGDLMGRHGRGVVEQILSVTLWISRTTGRVR